jgi:hypothetical protein
MRYISEFKKSHQKLIKSRLSVRIAKSTLKLKWKFGKSSLLFRCIAKIAAFSCRLWNGKKGINISLHTFTRKTQNSQRKAEQKNPSHDTIYSPQTNFPTGGIKCQKIAQMIPEFAAVRGAAARQFSRFPICGGLTVGEANV